MSELLVCALVLVLSLLLHVGINLLRIRDGIGLPWWWVVTHATVLPLAGALIGVGLIHLL